ncbi:MAG TPA: hypothetical protein VLG12_03875 [Candidatus Saccharimonadales bacterium]|nr:hypothetical protein [Candidatus Saccharimonadales bacterium]
MKRIIKKELIVLATKQNKVTEEFCKNVERYYAQYQLRLLSESELYQLLNIEE